MAEGILEVLVRHGGTNAGTGASTTGLRTGSEAQARVPLPLSPVAAVRPHDVALIVYTSGSTGGPKGAMITHRNVDAQTSALSRMFSWTSGDSALSFLPMAHAAERCMGHYNRIRRGVGTHYARSIDTLLDDLGVASPSHFGSVPRIFEKVHAGVRGEMARLEPPLARCRGVCPP